MMTVKSVTDFYFEQFEKIEIRIEMSGGIEARGRVPIYTKEEWEKFIEGFEDNEVVEVIFSSHYTHCGEWGQAMIAEEKMAVPHMFILYK